jgi:hypothetical protein
MGTNESDSESATFYKPVKTRIMDVAIRLSHSLSAGVFSDFSLSAQKRALQSP